MNRDQLQKLYELKYRGENISLCRGLMECFADSLLKLLFPAMCDQSANSFEEFEQNINHLDNDLREILSCLNKQLTCQLDLDEISKKFFGNLNQFEREMTLDAEYILNEDPAARSLNEVIICYPGFYATSIYRLAHFFFKEGLPLFPRILTEYAHRRTGIDIHPGAEIGCPFYIDHGTGVVIGETAKIGKRVKLYQGVTLGASTVAKTLVDKKRHPTIEDDVVIYSNATILGGKTIVGAGSVIGGNVWLVESVASNSKIFYKSTGES
ncbi:MAG: serine acetyltransferase [Halobacteriovoraceae bacterium]|nr:serine acetyltransferase [Halobacteriovoraceae bacterium]|tara:strand:+ start:7273 stop:8073 length:801 start_codon:yes stop_codon:yes gene_type:complete